MTTDTPVHPIPPAGLTTIEDVYPAVPLPGQQTVIVPLARRVNPEFVRDMEKIFNDVREGRITGLAIVAEQADLDVMTAILGHRSDDFKMIGHLHRLVHTYQRKMDKTVHEGDL